MAKMKEFGDGGVARILYMTSDERLKTLNQFNSEEIAIAAFIMAKHGWKGELEYLLNTQRLENLEIRNGRNQTLLEWCVQEGQCGMVSFLLEKGAQVNESHPPILIQALRSPLLGRGSAQNDVLGALLRHGADVNAVDEHGDTVLMAALQRKVADPFIFLLKRGQGLELDKRNKVGDTVLIMAVKKAQGSKFVQALFAHGVDMSEQDAMGHSILWLAAEAGSLRNVDFLVKNGAALTVDEESLITELVPEGSSISRALKKRGEPTHMPPWSSDDVAVSAEEADLEKENPEKDIRIWPFT